MSLLLLPVVGEGQDREVLVAACRAVHELTLVSADRAPAVSVAPFSSTGWDAGADEVPETWHVAGGRALKERIRDALDQALHDAGSHRPEGGAKSCVLLTPLVVLPAQGSAGIGAHVAELYRALGEVCSEIALDMGGEKLTGADVRLVPWWWMPSWPEEFPAEATAGLKALGAPAGRPIVHVGKAPNGAPRKWEGFGTTRLTCDLLMLRALACDRDRLDEILVPPREKSESPAFCQTNSGLFEFSYQWLVESALLKRLKPRDADVDGVLPDPDQFEQLAQAPAEEMEEEALKWIDRLKAAIDKDEIDSDAFSFGPAGTGGRYKFVHAVHPSFSVRPLLEDLDGTSLPPRTPDLHRDVMLALDAASADGLVDVMSVAMDSAQAAVLECQDQLEAQILEKFDYDEAAPGTREATGRALALLMILGKHLDALERSVSQVPPERPIQVILAARGLLKGWGERERELIERGDRIPSTYGLWAEIGGVGAGTAAGIGTVGLLASSALPAGALAATAAAGAGWWVRRNRQRLVEAYLRAWDEFEGLTAAQERAAAAEDGRGMGASRSGESDGSLLGDANAMARRLVKLANHRVRAVKFSATSGLRASLANVRQRLRTEMAGLGSLVTQDLGTRTHLLRRSESGPGGDSDGRFRMSGSQELRIQLDEREFHASLRSLMKPVLKFREVPKRLAVSEHRALLAEQVVRSLEEVGDDQQTALGHARARMDEAVGYSQRTGAVARLSDEYEAGRFRHVALIGEHVRSRILGAKPYDHHEAGWLDLGDGAALRDLAVFWSVRLVEAR